jgi:hypothetical protein
MCLRRWVLKGTKCIRDDVRNCWKEENLRFDKSDGVADVGEYEIGVCDVGKEDGTEVLRFDGKCEVLIEGAMDGDFVSKSNSTEGIEEGVDRIDSEGEGVPAIV